MQFYRMLASAQLFRVWLLLGERFSVVFACYLLVGTSVCEMPSTEFKANWISDISYFVEFDLASLKKSEPVQTESLVIS